MTIQFSFVGVITALSIISLGISIVVCFLATRRLRTMEVTETWIRSINLDLEKSLMDFRATIADQSGRATTCALADCPGKITRLNGADIAGQE
jgi:hypothetical protein